MTEPRRNSNAAFLATALPLGTYFLLKGFGYFTMGVISAMALLVLLCGLLIKQFKWVDLTFLLFFGLMLLCVSWLEIEWVNTYRNVFAPAMLASLAWGSVLAGKPFTEQYAKERMSSIWWNNPHFRRVNRILAWAWGSVFAAGAFISFLSARNEQFPYWLSLCITGSLSIMAGLFTVRFPVWYRRVIYLPQAGPNPLPDQ